MSIKTWLPLIFLVFLAGCVQVTPPMVPSAPEPAPKSDLSNAMTALAATLPAGDIAVVRVANFSAQRADVDALTQQLLTLLAHQGRQVADLSDKADAYDLLGARQAGRAGQHVFLLYGQIRQDGQHLRLRVMNLSNGIIVWSRELPWP